MRVPVKVFEVLFKSQSAYCAHVLNILGWIKLFFDTIDSCNFVINEFNLTFEVQNMENEAFENASF